MFGLRITGVALTVALAVSGCSKEPVPEEIIRPLYATEVTTDADRSGRSFPGRAQAHQEVDLSFRVNGPLIELPNDIVGKSYKQGEVIARIDPRDYEVKIEDVEGKLERSRSAVKRAQGEYERELAIFKEDPGATSKTAVDRKRDQRDSAAGEVRSLEASLEAAQDNLRYASLLAPFDGTITAKYVDNFQDVRAKQAVVRLLDASRIQIVVDIPETLISKLPQVDEFWVVFDAFPERKITAELYEVGTEASLTTRTYPVTLIMNQPEDIDILAGMAGRAYGRRGAEQGGGDELVVPASAVFTLDEGTESKVWVVSRETGTVTLRTVATGGFTNNGIVITSGVEAGEWVATAGVHSLKEGQRVRILESGGE
jgi:RND family efflux transporter MFP subunit